MTSTTQRNDPEEAKKELIATINASRELGPEMDDTLTDRFMEKLKSLRAPGSFDPTAARTKLHGLLQSARGSDPGIDSTLADGFLASLQPPRLDPQPYAYGGPPAPMEYGPMGQYRGNAGQIAPLVIFAAIFIVALILSHGEFWWFFWIIPAGLGWARRGYYRNHRQLYRDQRQQYRNDRILNRDDVYPPLPPQRPPEII